MTKKGVAKPFQVMGMTFWTSCRQWQIQHTITVAYLRMIEGSYDDLRNGYCTQKIRT